ncbi:MAG TPA: hypothetical protein VEF06_06880, partial [Bryobacteraceae bacterium]|nr:hypothetical protein [Bryobacteraceae bacterium]
MERILAARIHGRYLMAPAESGAAGILAGFHGYGEDAETMMERLQAIPGSERWLKVSVEALNRFYERRTNRVVANWMTRRDRERAIEDNAVWVASCLDAAAAESGAGREIVFAGFSQGAAMAFRAAGRAALPVAGVIAVGGDVPPELDREALGRIGRVLLARGTRDEWYTREKFAADQARLRA